MATRQYGHLLANIRWNKNRGTKPNRKFAGGKPEGITLHETSNLFADARGNASYYASRRSRGASVHFFVDAGNVWQSLDLSEQSWSAGDGRGGWDARYAALEVCVNDDVAGAWQHAIEFVRALRAGNHIGDGVNFHHDCSGKWCPALLLQHPEVYRNVVSRDGRGRIRDPQARTNRTIAVERAGHLAASGVTEASVLGAIREPAAAQTQANDQVSGVLNAMADNVKQLQKLLG